MLKVRIIPTLLFKDVGLVKGVGFDSWRRTGSALQAVRVYNLRGVDEIVFVDITATPQGREPDFQAIDDLADECFMPMTVGGGVRSVDHVGKLLAVGADKVCVNTGALERPKLVTEASQRFGAQCVVVSIDVVQNGDGDWEVFSHCGKRPTGRDPVDWAKEVEAAGAGEILLTSINRDGTFEGYDVELTRRVCDAVTVPVIASGGAGCYEHMAEVVIDGGADAVAAASIFHFTEATPREAKLHLRSRGINVRLSQ